jgi:hypothetical protein
LRKPLFTVGQYQESAATIHAVLAAGPGVYIVRGDSLVMQPDTGGTMVSTIALENDRTLKFTPVGDAEKLTFTR